MRKLILLIPAVAIAAAACGGTSSAGPASPGGAQGEVPLSATPAATATSGPQFDDRTWNAGDCLYDPNVSTEGASFWKVPCSAPNADRRIAVKITDINASTYQVCNGNAEWKAAAGRLVGAETLDADHFNFCIINLHPPASG
jgi:hypothetical protein